MTRASRLPFSPPPRWSPRRAPRSSLKEVASPSQLSVAPHIQIAATQLQDLVPDPWDFGQFIERVRTLRGRGLVLRRLPFSDDGGISAAWVPTDHRDLIFYSAHAHAYRRIAIICHELAHIFLGHTPDDLGFTEDGGLETLEGLLAHDPDPALLANFGLRLRHDYDTPGEVDAEQVARLVMTAIRLDDPDIGRQVATTFGW